MHASMQAFNLIQTFLHAWKVTKHEEKKTNEKWHVESIFLKYIYLKVVKGGENVNRSHLELQISFTCAIEAHNLGDM